MAAVAPVVVALSAVAVAHMVGAAVEPQRLAVQGMAVAVCTVAAVVVFI